MLLFVLTPCTAISIVFDLILYLFLHNIYLTRGFLGQRFLYTQNNIFFFVKFYYVEKTFECSPWNIRGVFDIN